MEEMDLPTSLRKLAPCAARAVTFSLLPAVVISACSTARTADAAAGYEVWAMDQGTHVIHVFNSALEEIASIDLGSQGARVPHMIEFTPDQRYGFAANPGTGNVAVIRTEDRSVLTLIPTGPRTHHAAVSPDGRRVLVSVIGAPSVPWDGKLVELLVDAENEHFTIGRELVLANDPLFAARRSEFKESAGAVCLAFTADGSQGYVTLGPALDEGGVVVVDMNEFRLVEVYPASQLDANCGTILAPDQRHMYLVGGDREVGAWHAVDTRTRRHVHRAESGGHDAHGSAVTPDGREYWLVNRVTSNAIVVDPRSSEVIAEIPFTGKTPDIVAISPDSRYAFITLRGPNPVTMPHLAVGETPGFSVFDVRTRTLLRLIEPAKGDDRSDFHGIAIRRLN
jgi:DNA-binding beta-propeller fold protein YncE